MQQTTHYSIVKGESTRDLEESILDKLAAGWELQGGLSVTCSPISIKPTYYQAMVYRVPSTDDVLEPTI